MNLIDLPPELVEEILVYIDPTDVARVAQACTALRSLIYHPGDSKLWRELYLQQPFDDPRLCVSQDGVPHPVPTRWKQDLQKIIRARSVLDDVSRVKSRELETILQTVLALCCNVRPYTTTDMRDHDEISKNLLWVAAKLRHGVLDRLQEKSETFAERQLAARLHTYFGLTKRDTTSRSLVRSRAFVYLLRHYQPENEYGPFLQNGSVNWEHVQAIHHVVSMHVVELEENAEFEYAIFPMSMPFTQIVVPRGVDLNTVQDWAGVEGEWVVSFCFCDHRELLRFNEASSAGLDTTILEQPGFQEVFRSLNVKLCVAKAEPDPKHPTRPIIYFYGEMDTPSGSTMTGKVSMTVGNHAQWHFVSGEQGNAMWSCEGVQLGGLQSSFGILGSWTTIFHDNDDPVGPFWMRKRRLWGGQ